MKLKHVAYFFLALGLLGLVVGELYIQVHCKWKWTSFDIVNLDPSELVSVHVWQPVTDPEYQLFENSFVITDTIIMKNMMCFMQYNSPCQMNHPNAKWKIFLEFQFRRRDKLELEVLKTDDQGCLIEACSDCFGVKYNFRNDTLGAYLEMLANR